MAFIITLPVVTLVIVYNNKNLRKNHGGIDFKKYALDKDFDIAISENKAIQPDINYTSYSTPFAVYIYNDSIREMNFTDYFSANQIGFLHQFEITGILIQQVDPDWFEWIKTASP